ncbi:hypothetical protein [Streptococcus phage 115]|nr:hypothetical protein [Streptococcus phage 115]
MCNVTLFRYILKRLEMTKIMASNPEKKHLDKKTKLFIDEPFDNRVTKGDEVYVDTLRNCLFQQASMAYTDKQIASIYKEWLQSH